MTLPTLMHGHRPIDACIVSVGAAHFQPFESKFLRLLLHSCRIIISISPGCRPSAVERMKRNSAAYCNSNPSSSVLDTRNEATVGLAIALVLTTIQGLFHTEKGYWLETSSHSALLGCDTSGIVLGIAGMGSIGKRLAEQAALHGVRIKYNDRRRLCIDDEASYKAWYCHSVRELLWQSDMVCECVLTDPVGTTRHQNLLL